MKALRSLAVFVVTVGVLSAAVAWRVENPDDSSDQLIAPLADAAPKYWKGNLHTHTFWSDGDDFPEMIADWYRRNGYHFLTLSDHNTLQEGKRWIDLKKNEAAVAKYRKRFGVGWVETRIEKDKDQKEKEQVRLKPLAEFRTVLESPGRFLLIQGEEITHKFAKAPVHINGINLRDKIGPLNGDSVSETIRANLRQVAEQEKKTGVAMFASLNHPNFGWGVRAEDIARNEELRFFEVYNGHPSVNNYGDAAKPERPGTERMWDIVLAQRLGKHRTPLVYGLATDDAHKYHQFNVAAANPGRGWTMVKARHLSPEAIVESIRAGEFYLSTGVVLEDVTREKDRLALRIHGEDGVKYTTQFLATSKSAPLDPTPLAEGAKEPDGSRTYSDKIGKVVAESTLLTPSYRFTGDELYVRARVTSSRLQRNPFKKGDVETAWTQPVVP